MISNIKVIREQKIEVAAFITRRSLGCLEITVWGRVSVFTENNVIYSSKAPFAALLTITRRKPGWLSWRGDNNLSFLIIPIRPARRCNSYGNVQSYSRPLTWSVAEWTRRILIIWSLRFSNNNSGLANFFFVFAPYSNALTFRRLVECAAI